MYYFAYGSNMNLEHMRRLCGWNFTVVGPAFLKDYELGPDSRGYANIRPQAGKQVAGVLYDIDQRSLVALDEFEGYPDVFSRPQITVKDSSGNNFNAWVYVEPKEQFGGQAILRKIIFAAR